MVLIVASAGIEGILAEAAAVPIEAVSLSALESRAGMSATRQLTLFEVGGPTRQLSLFALEGEVNPFSLGLEPPVAAAAGQRSLFALSPGERQLTLFSDDLITETAGSSAYARLRSLAQFLKREGVADPVNRRSIIESGLQGPIGPDTPVTLARFRRLFPDTIAQGKAFGGRLGDIEARVATLNEALAIEASGLLPRFEFAVTAGGRTAWVDLVGAQGDTSVVVDAVQVIRGLPRAGNTFTFDDREFANALIIDQALGSGVLRFVVVGP